MNFAIKSLNLTKLLGIFIASSLIIASCKTSKNGTRVKSVKNWVTWNVQFKPGTSDENISRTKAEIDKHITNHINRTDPDHTTILSYSISYLVDHRDQRAGVRLTIRVRLGLNALEGTRAPKGPVPPIPNHDMYKLTAQ